jgi:hypothetical protein
MKARGRPKIPSSRKRQKLNVTIDPGLLKKASKEAEIQGISLSALVEDAMKNRLLGSSNANESKLSALPSPSSTTARKKNGT